MACGGLPNRVNSDRLRTMSPRPRRQEAARRDGPASRHSPRIRGLTRTHRVIKRVVSLGLTAC
jgi:hypothetical protein